MNPVLSKVFFESQTKDLGGRIAQIRSWVIHSLTYPVIDISFTHGNRKAFRVRMKCENYNELPPSIELLSKDEKFLKKVPIGTFVLNQGPHPITKRPFICNPGSLEYHTHRSHKNDLWDNYRKRPEYNLGGILTQIYNAWCKTIDPPSDTIFTFGRFHPQF